MWITRARCPSGLLPGCRTLTALGRFGFGRLASVLLLLSIRGLLGVLRVLGALSIVGLRSILCIRRTVGLLSAFGTLSSRRFARIPNKSITRATAE